MEIDVPIFSSTPLMGYFGPLLNCIHPSVSQSLLYATAAQCHFNNKGFNCQVSLENARLKLGRFPCHVISHL